MQRIYALFTLLMAVLSLSAQESERLTLLHTSDTHSCIVPEKADAKGGVLNRAKLFAHLRDSIGADEVLLLDCGDFSQGSLYYEVGKGDVEVRLMNAMHYDAAAIGNHEFDFGLENLARLLRMAQFPFVCANYDFAGTCCEGLVKRYVVLERDGKRIGIFGLSPELQGLVDANNCQGVKYTDPVVATKEVVERLQAEGCDVIICLSHLGWNMATGIDDEHIAAATSGVDVILGGHSHTTFDAPRRLVNSEGGAVVVNHIGKNGRKVGVINLTFNEK